MKLPVVCIIGRPNVGKSSLFNRILGRRAAVVSDRDGVTDAALGAAGLGDIGEMFPDTSEVGHDLQKGILSRKSQIVPALTAVMEG